MEKNSKNLHGNPPKVANKTHKIIYCQLDIKLKQFIEELNIVLKKLKAKRLKVLTTYLLFQALSEPSTRL